MFLLDLAMIKLITYEVLEGYSLNSLFFIGISRNF